MGKRIVGCTLVLALAGFSVTNQQAVATDQPASSDDLLPIVQTISLPDSAYSVRISDGGAYLAIGTWKGVALFIDVPTGRVLRSFDARTRSVDVHSSDAGTEVVIVSLNGPSTMMTTTTHTNQEDHVRLWDTGTGGMLGESGPFKHFSAFATFSGDSAWAAVGYEDPPTRANFLIYSASPFEQRRLLRPPIAHSLSACRLSGDASTLVALECHRAGIDNIGTIIAICDTSSGTWKTKTFPGSTPDWRLGALASDGRFCLLTGIMSPRKATATYPQGAYVGLLDVQKIEISHIKQIPGDMVMGSCLFKDGKAAIVAAREGVYRWEIGPDILTVMRKIHFQYEASFSANGSIIASYVEVPTPKASEPRHLCAIYRLPIPPADAQGKPYAMVQPEPSQPTAANPSAATTATPQSTAVAPTATNPVQGKSEQNSSLAPAETAPGTTLKEASPEGPAVQNEDIELLLGKVVENVSFPGVPLSEAVEILRHTVAQNVTFILDPNPTLHLSNVVVALDLKNVTFCTVLEVMLRMPRPSLDFTISHGAIYVSTPDACLRKGGAAMKKELDNLEARTNAATRRDLEALLDQPLEEVRLPADITLMKALDVLKQITGKKASFIADPDAARIILNVRVPELRLKDTTLRKTLQTMLRPNHLDFTIFYCLIYISSPEGCRRVTAQR